jgi:hypothetical protein
MLSLSHFINDQNHKAVCIWILVHHHCGSNHIVCQTMARCRCINTISLVCCISATLHWRMKADLKSEIRVWRSWRSVQRETAKPKICASVKGLNSPSFGWKRSGIKTALWVRQLNHGLTSNRTYIFSAFKVSRLFVGPMHAPIWWVRGLFL